MRRQLKWTDSVRKTLFEEVKNYWGPYKTWTASTQPHHHMREAYDSTISDLADLLSKDFPAQASTAHGPYTMIQLQQQLNFALQQGLRGTGYSHKKASHLSTTIDNLEAAVQTGFMTKEDIHPTIFQELANVDHRTAPNLAGGHSFFVTNKTSAVVDYHPELQDYLKYNREVGDYDWTTVDLMIRRLKVAKANKKSGYTRAQKKAFTRLQEILVSFRTGERPLNYILPENVLDFIQVRHEEFDDENLTVLEASVNERGIDAPCLGRWVDQIARTVIGDNGNHRWKISLKGIDKGTLPPDFKMPFMLLTQQEVRDCNLAFEVAKDMANIEVTQAGSTRADIQQTTRKIINEMGWASELLKVDMSRSKANCAKTGRKQPKVIMLKNQVHDRHGGGRWTEREITNDVYKTINELRLKSSDSKIEHRDKAKMESELNDFLGWETEDNKNESFHYPENSKLGTWKIAILDKATGSSENHYMRIAPQDMLVSGVKLMHVFRDTTHKGSVENIVKNFNKKMSQMALQNTKHFTYLKKVSSITIGKACDDAFLTPHRIAVPNFINGDMEVKLGGKTHKLLQNTGNFIIIEKAQIVKFIKEKMKNPDHQVPLEWIFKIAKQPTTRRRKSKFKQQDYHGIRAHAESVGYELIPQEIHDEENHSRQSARH